jgi:hypothetical protein
MAVLEVSQEPAAESEAARFTETTRLLCAAAYTEPTFAQEVVEEFVEEEYRAVSVPPGVDPEPVLRHCLAAAAQKRLRDRVLAVILTGAVLLVVLGNHPFSLGVLELAGLAVATVVTYRLATVKFLQKFRLGRWLAAYLMFGLLGLCVLVGGSSLAMCFLAAWAIVAYDLWSSTFGTAAKRLNRLAFDPAKAPEARSEIERRRIEEIAEGNRGNLTVYSYSDFLPFLGSGIDLDGWSFVIDLRKGREDDTGDRLEPEPVQARKLYAEVESALGQLGMENLTIEDRVFVCGTDIRDDRDLLPSPTGRPSTSVGDADVRRLMAVPTHRVRHYRCVRVVDWRGELVLSLFLRFGVASERLFCELSQFLLTPLKGELHRVDRMIHPEFGDLLWLARRSLMTTLPLLVRSPSVVLRPLRRQRRRARLLKRVEHDPFFDYGAAFTALDRARSEEYSRYFQRLDKEMHMKVIERTILDAVVDVLDEHNIETAELVDRRRTIINHGIMLKEGSVNAESVAVGPGAGIIKGSGSGGSASDG